MSLGGLFDLEANEKRIAELEEQMTTPGFWDDQESAQQVINETNHLKGTVQTFEKMADRVDNVEVLYELVKEENDQELAKELNEEISSLLEDMNQFELEMLLSEPYDANNAILELHPGAGGT